MKSIATLSLAAAVAAAPAWAFTADNWHEVNPVSQVSFEVIGEPGSGPTQYWCAAGDYALRALGVAGTQRVYISKPSGPSATRPGKTAVTFSLNAPADGRDTGISLSVKDVGDNLSAVFAAQYCNDWKVREF